MNGGGGGGNPGPTGWPPPADGCGIITTGWPCNMLSDFRDPARDCESPIKPPLISPPAENQERIVVKLNQSFYLNFFESVIEFQNYLYFYLCKLILDSYMVILKYAYFHHKMTMAWRDDGLM